MLTNLWKRLARRDCSAPNHCGSYHRGKRLALEPLEQRRLLAVTEFSINPYLQDPTDTSVVFIWETDEEYPCPDADNFVEYRVAGSGGPFTSVEGDENADEWIAEIELSGLTPKTTYEFRVKSKATGYDWGYSPEYPTTYSFTTFPDPDADPSDPRATPNEFRFAAYGDNRSNPDRHGQVVADIVGGVSPAFVLHAGDLVNKGQRTRAEWNTEYFAPADDLLTGEVYVDSSSRPAVPVLPILGNHEYSGGGDTRWYNSYMHTADDGTNNEDYFAFTYGNVRMIGLNTNAGGDSYEEDAPPFTEGSAQYNWLVTELQSLAYRNADWHVVYFHQPAYTHADKHPESPEIKQHLVPLFEEYGMDLVFYGHNHCYERYSVLDGVGRGPSDPVDPNDVNYVLTGGGGAPGNAEKPGDPDPPYKKGRFGSSTSDDVLHHTTMDVNVAERTLDFNAVFVDRQDSDTLALGKDYTFRGGELNVWGDGSSGSITIGFVPGSEDLDPTKKFVTVNDKRVAGVETSQVTEIVVNGSSIAETIDLSAVTTANGFTTGLNGNIRISGEGGDDTITGSEFGETYVFSGSNLGTDSLNPVGGNSYLGDGDTILVAPDSVATIDDNLSLDDGAEYAVGIRNHEADPPNGLLHVAGNVSLAGTLGLEAISKLHAPTGQPPVEWYGYETRTIINATAGVSGTFDTVPEALPEEPVLGGPNDNWGQGHLGDGVFLTRGGPHENGVEYTADAVLVHLFQAADGDTNGDAILEGLDLQAILAAQTFGTGIPADWTTGDFTDGVNGGSAGVVDGEDIQAILATGLWGTVGPYVSPGEGLQGSGPVGFDGGGDPLVVMGGGQSVVDLIVAPDGLTVDTHDVTINGWVFASDVGVFTGDPAILLGFFRLDRDDQISSAFFTLTGQHFLGDVIGEEHTGVDPLEDLRFTYTIDGQAGIYEGNVVLDPGGGMGGSPPPAETSTSYQLNPDADSLAWLYEFDPAGAQQQTPVAQNPGAATVDLLATVN